MNPIRARLKQHGAGGYGQIEKYEAHLYQIYIHARMRIETQLERFMADRRSSFTGPRLVKLMEEIQEVFPEFEEQYRETYEHALSYMAKKNYQQVLYDMGLDEPVYGKLDKSLYENMRDDAFTHIAGATRNMEKEIVSNLRKMSAQVMREAALTGETRAAVSRRLAFANQYGSGSIFQRPGNKATFVFRDAANREWKTDAYFKMLGRTLLHNNSRETYIAACAKEGNDIVTVSVSGNSCDHCRQWENRLLSISGKTPGLPTLQSAMSSGLFHPNCTHRIVAVPESLAKRYYDAQGKPVEKEKTEKMEKTNRTGRTEKTETHQEHVARRQKQWEDAYDNRRDKWHQSILDAGGSKEIADELADLYTPEMAKIGYPPEVKFVNSSRAYFSRGWYGQKDRNGNLIRKQARGGELILNSDTSDWNGHPVTAVHEFGHWVDHHTRFKAIKYTSNMQDVENMARDFVLAAKEDWNILKSKSKGFLEFYYEDVYFDIAKQRTEGGYWLEIHKKLFGDKNNLNLTERKIFRQYQDTIGSITNGKYGGGHKKSEYKDQWGCEEAFAQTYSAYQRNDSVYKLEFPNMWKYIENMMKGLKNE